MFFDPVQLRSVSTVATLFYWEAPFNSGHFAAALASTEKNKSYKCGQNYFRHNVFCSPTSGVFWLQHVASSQS